MLFYKCLKISLINFLNLPKKGAKRLFRLDSLMKIKIEVKYCLARVNKLIQVSFYLTLLFLIIYI